MNNILYPASPSDVDASKLLPSAAFKKQVVTVMASIVLFVLVYMLLLLTSTLLAIACIYLGITLVLAVPRFLTLVLGVGLMATGVSVIFFLIKFIFAVSKKDDGSRTVITESDQPEFFAFIRKLANETKTPLPGKIYLSDDVNASVSYNSSFWSMFFPVKKNLQIGLGLVNCVNISEFKAVIAHEFGHFSQRSMKLGSFTYNVNQVIYNLLFENSSYSTFLLSWGKLHGLLSLFVGLTARIVQAIQWILRKMYQVVNKNYLALGREMEFHADAVAASVAGGNNLVSALGRIEIASSCYDTAINHANELLKSNKKSRNIFSNQLCVFQSLAKDQGLTLKQELPEVSFHFLQTFSKTRVRYTDQWASHPTMEERRSMLDKLSVNIDPLETRAWKLFANPEKLQEQMTKHLYRTAPPETQTQEYDSRFYEDWYTKRRDQFILPAVYNGFYDGRFISTTSWNFTAAHAPVKPFELLFSEENGRLQSAIDTTENDLATLKAIQKKQIDVSSFDFDGNKYTVKETESIILQLEKELEEKKARMAVLDQEAYAFFCNKAGPGSGEIKNLYLQYHYMEQKYESYVALSGDIFILVGPFYGGDLTLEEVTTRVSTLKENYEGKLKQRFQEILNEKIITPESNEELFNKITHFGKTSYAYLINNEFQSNELNDLCELIEKVAEVLYKHRFSGYKNLVERQLDYL